MTTIDQIRAAASNGLTRAEVIATVLGGRKMTEAEQTAYDQARGIWKLREAKRKQEKAAGPRVTSAQAHARATAAATDLGELPSVAHPKFRKKAEAVLADWGTRYCLPSLLKWEPSPRLRDYADDLQRIVDGGGKVHIRFPRGAGKTTWCRIAILWGLITGRIRFAVIVANNQAAADRILASIWTELEHNDALFADYPEACHAIRAAEGIGQRFAGQHYGDVRPMVRKTARLFSLPVLPRSRCSGAILQSFGAGSGIRGLSHGAERPDLILLDDIQDRRDATSPTTVGNLEEWIQSDVLGLAGADKALRVAMTSTPIVSGDLSERYADRDAHPEWETISYPLLESMPTRMDLWDEYARIHKADLAQRLSTFPSAMEFYRIHRAEMDEGAKVLDPQAYDHERELSAIQAAIIKRLTMGERAFDAEYQLTPPTAAAIVAVTARLVMDRTNGTSRGELPAEARTHVFAAIDVNTIAGLTWVILAVGRKQTAAVVDYGRVTGPGSRLVPEGTDDRKARAIVAEALHRLVGDLIRKRWPVGSNQLRVGAVWVDSGYMTETVDKVTSYVRNRLNYPNCYASRGMDNEHYATAAAKTIVTRRNGVDLRERDGQRWMVLNADEAKEQAQSAFLAPPLQPGSISLPGRDGREHWDFANEVAAERLVDRSVSARGIDSYVWSLRPGAANHYLDALAATVAMARWHGVWSSDDALAPSTPAPIRKPAKVARPKIRTARRWHGG